jgi:hypothetical protein
MPVRRQIAPIHRGTVQPVADDAAQCSFAVSALGTQLADAVSFAEPSLKPDALALPTNHQAIGDKAQAALVTVPTLLAGRCVTAPFDPIATTPPTPLFGASLNSLRTQHHNTMNHHQVQQNEHHFLAIRPMLSGLSRTKLQGSEASAVSS